MRLCRIKEIANIIKCHGKRKRKLKSRKLKRKNLNPVLPIIKVKMEDITKRRPPMENVLADLSARRRVKHNTKRLNSK